MSGGFVTYRSPAKAEVQSYPKLARGSAIGALRRAWAPAFAGERV